MYFRLAVTETRLKAADMAVLFLWVAVLGAVQLTNCQSENGLASNQILDVVECDVSSDVVFLLDASSSLRPEDYEMSKTFVKNMISSFDIGPDRVRVGVAYFNRWAYIGFNLSLIQDPSIDVSALLESVDDLGSINRGTYTNRGLETVRTQMLTTEAGDRPGVQDIVIVITDGRAKKRDETTKEAELLRKAGAIIFAVAVGRWNSDEQLQSLASKPTKDHRFSVKKFEALDSLKYSLTNRICKVLEVPPAAFPECNEKADLLFILDGSTSISKESFEQAKSFVTQMLESFIVSPAYLRVAVIVYSQFSRVAFHLDKHRTIDKVMEAVDGLSQPGRTGTLTDKALASARKDVFNPIRGDRLLAPNIIVLLSDGKSRRPELTKKEARLAQEFGATLITVGIGRPNQLQELQDIASVDPESRSVLNHPVENFAKLQTIIKELVNESCEVSLPEEIPECAEKVDIVFVVDMSRGFRKKGEIIKKLIKFMASRHSFATENVRVGLITYNKEAFIKLKLSEGTNVNAVNDRLNKLGKPKFSRRISNALDLLRTEAYLVENGGRPEARKVAVIISGGNSKNIEATSAAAAEVHDEGIATFALTVGKRIKSEEANALASLPTETYLYRVETLEQLFSFGRKLKERICSGPVINMENPVV